MPRVNEELLEEVSRLVSDVCVHLLGVDAIAEELGAVWTWDPRWNGWRLDVEVPDAVVGLLIGAGGRTADAIRTIAKAKARAIGLDARADIRVRRRDRLA